MQFDEILIKTMVLSTGFSGYHSQTLKLSGSKSKRTGLSTGDLGVAKRLVLARNSLGVSQEIFASSAGITKASLAGYELGRVALRFEVALRLCRQWIIGEEWLATGHGDAFFVAAGEKLRVEDTPAARKVFEPLVMRQCVDLLSEPIFLQVPPGLSFHEAYSRYLASTYSRLVGEFLLLPRIKFTDHPEPGLSSRLVSALLERWLLLLSNRAHREERDPWHLQQAFLNDFVTAGIAAFKKRLRAD